MDLAVRRAAKPRGFSNRFVAAILNSRVHRLFSQKMCLVSYQGRQSGRDFVTPTQYVRLGDSLAVLVARPETKTWWKNFRGDGGWPIDVRVAGKWCEMTGRVVEGAVDDEEIAPLLEGYLSAFPAASKLLCVDDSDRRSTARVVFVKCDSRASPDCEHESRPCFECMIGC